MSKNIPLFILFILLYLSAGAQSVKKLLKEADGHYQYKDYTLAIPIYESVLQKEPNHPDKIDINYKIGYAYLQSTYRSRSLSYFKKVYEVAPQYNNLMDYYLGQAYQLNHNFDKALLYYGKYKERADKKKELAEVDKKIRECTYGKSYKLAPVDTKINNLGEVINSQYPDYVPVISADEKVLIFTSRREGTTGNERDTYDHLYYEDVYIAEKKEGQWQAPQNIGAGINSREHDACIALSADGKLLFVYKQGKGGMGDIFLSERKDGNWTTPTSLGNQINTKHREPSASISIDSNTLYFSSDRPGGYGGLDLYVSTKQADGSWGAPVNLGPTINTPYDDDGPFVHDEKTLYFSSQGHTSMGGFDIFVIQKQADGSWSTPLNLGYPINTADDDIYFVLSADNKTGYYASSKEGGYGEKDIYSIDMPTYKEIELYNTIELVTQEMTIEKLEEKVDLNETITILKGTITDKKTGKKLTANITLVDLARDEVLEEMVSEAPIGKYKTVMKSGKNYLITVAKEGYLFHSENFDIPTATGYQEIILDVALEPLEVGAKMNLKVFFDFDKAFLRAESKTELNRLIDLMETYPTLQLEISGHTDAIGTNEKNEALSARRAQSVVDYLVKNGIKAERLLAKGYGEAAPVATNDTPEGRQMNRRTECKIITK
ncbi:MAG: OmpA family protein [Thermonemataceae bacterium]